METADVVVTNYNTKVGGSGGRTVFRLAASSLAKRFEAFVTEHPLRVVKLDSGRFAFTDNDAPYHVIVCSFETGEKIHSFKDGCLKQQSWALETIRDNADDKTASRLMVVDIERRFAMWDVRKESMRLVAKLELVDAGSVFALRAFPEWKGLAFISAGKECIIRVFDLTKQVVVQRLNPQGGHSQIWGLEADPPSGRLFSAGSTGSLHVWDPLRAPPAAAAAAGVISPVMSHAVGHGGITSMYYAPDLDTAVLGSSSGQAVMCDLRGGKPSMTTLDLGNKIKAIYGLARVGKSRYVGTGSAVCSFTTDGKQREEFDAESNFWGFGVCAIGSDYDRPPFFDQMALDEELVARVAFIQEVGIVLRRQVDVVGGDLQKRPLFSPLWVW